MLYCKEKGGFIMALLHVGASPVSFTDFAVHSHDCYEIILNEEGTGTAVIGDREYPFSPGTIHIIPPNMPHSKRSPEGFRDIYLHTDALLGLERSAAAPILLSDDSSHTAESLMSVLLVRYLTEPRSSVVTKTLFDALLELIGELARKEESDPVVDALIHAITSSYNNPEFQVTDALLSTGYSKDHIRRRFRQFTGLTPNAYLRAVRLRYARRLLKQQDTLHLPIHEIALMCGYYDVAYFCRIFRRETGSTPTEYAGRAEK
jgi:AraC-like DNA-binding protein